MGSMITKSKQKKIQYKCNIMIYYNMYINLHDNSVNDQQAFIYSSKPGDTFRGKQNIENLEKMSYINQVDIVFIVA